jgi:N-acetylneuraminate synthase
MGVEVVVRIGNRDVGPGQPVLCVAELSGNHLQSWDRVSRLVNAAWTAGADAVKGQAFTPDGMTLDIDDAAHRCTWAGRQTTLHALYSQTAMPYEWHARLMAMCAELGMLYFASEFTPADVDMMDSLGAPCHKCASFELTDLPLIRHMASKRKPVILSTGMAEWSEIADAVDLVHGDRILLRCTSAYPAGVEDANLRMMSDLQMIAPAGLSDHTRSNTVVTAAVALGACLVERHLTLSRSDGGPDAAFSDEPHEFAEMVAAIRDTTAALGTVRYGPTPSEEPNLRYRRSLWVTADIAAGEPFTAANVASLRPVGGAEPAQLPFLLGHPAPRAYRRGEPLTWSDRQPV